MKKLFFILSIFLSVSLFAKDDNAYFVYLTDKRGTAFSLNEPNQYLSPRALERRTRQGLSVDSTDLPVSQVYTDSLRHLGAVILHTSRWINGVSLIADESIIETIRHLGFVDSIDCTRRDTSKHNNAEARRRAYKEDDTPIEYGVAKLQTQLINLHRLHEEGFRGQGMMVAVVDNGFLNVDKRAAFSKAMQQIVDTLNLIPQNGGLYRAGNHGTYVFSIIAGYLDGEFSGGATEASYVLIRSEDDKEEYKLEVDNQVRAFEFADSIGADIVNSSLGYYVFDDTLANYSYKTLDGRTARNSIAATMAARKGMVMCLSAGNEGNKPWHYICTPGDADSVLTVGSVDSVGHYSSYSSVGPAADGRIKPDIATMGTRAGVISVDGSQSRGSGTSFASPIAAAMVACLWSALPELTNMQLIERIKRYCSQSLNPDNQIGWGVPDAWSCYLDHFVEDTPTENIQQYLPDSEIRYYDLLGRRIGCPQSVRWIKQKNGNAIVIR